MLKSWTARLYLKRNHTFHLLIPNVTWKKPPILDVKPLPCNMSFPEFEPHLLWWQTKDKAQHNPDLMLMHCSETNLWPKNDDFFSINESYLLINTFALQMSCGPFLLAQLINNITNLNIKL